MEPTVEQKAVFSVGTTDNEPVLMIGVSRTCFDFMIKENVTSTIDLTKLDIPLKVVIYAGEGHSDVMGVVEAAAKKQGLAISDRRREDFGIDEPQQ